MHKNDVLSILSLVVGISSLATDAAFSNQLSTLLGGSAPGILAVLGLLGTVAAQVIRILSVPTSPSVPTPPVVQPTSTTQN